RAGAAVAGVAADMASRQVEVVADEVDQQLPGLDLALVLDAVHGDRDVHQLRPAAWCAARIASTFARCARYSLEAWTSEGGCKPARSTASPTSSTLAASITTGTASTH